MASYRYNGEPHDASSWDLTPGGLSVLASYVNRAGAEEKSYDDLFDGPAYRAAQSAHAARGHARMPGSHTANRSLVRYETQGLAPGADTRHWQHALPTAAAPAAAPCGQAAAARARAAQSRYDASLRWSAAPAPRASAQAPPPALGPIGPSPRTFNSAA
jgi:hypothetical protein